MEGTEFLVMAGIGGMVAAVVIFAQRAAVRRLEAGVAAANAGKGEKPAETGGIAAHAAALAGISSALEKLREQVAALRKGPEGNAADGEAGNALRGAAAELRSAAEAVLSRQAGLRDAMGSLERELAGIRERIQSLADAAGEMRALPEKTESVLRRLEERSAELLEENALKSQEALLQALERNEGAGPNVR